MKKYILLALVTAATSASANIRDVLVCSNNDWTITIGVNGAPEDYDAVSIVVEGSEGGEGVYTAEIPKNSLEKQLKEGLSLNDPSDNEKAVVALLTIEGKTAKLVSGGSIRTLTCEEVN